MLHQVGVLFDLYYDARKHKSKSPTKEFQWKFGYFEARPLTTRYVNLTVLFTGVQDGRRAAGMWVGRNTGQGHQNEQENTAARSPFSCT